MRFRRPLRIAVALAAAFLAAALAAAPAATEPPPNSSPDHAVPLDARHGTTSESTTSATLDENGPTSACGEDDLAAGLWYRLTNIPRRDVIIRMWPMGHLDAAVLAVFRERDDRLVQVDCSETNDETDYTTIALAAKPGDLVLVAQQADSPAGSFVLRTLVPTVPDRMPGRPLSAAGAGTGTLDEYLNPSDLWHVNLRAGTTYTLTFTTRRSNCSRVYLYAPRKALDREAAVARTSYNNDVSFTPGPDGGGRYVLQAFAACSDKPIPYRVLVNRASLDDTAPGVPLGTRTWKHGLLRPNDGDALDLYRFVVPRRSDLLLALRRPRPKTVSLLLVREDGKRIAAGQAIRRSVPAGTYYAVVHAQVGTPTTHYAVRLDTHEVSRVRANGELHLVVPLRTPVTLTASIGAPTGRVARLQIDRFDPLEGWLFVARMNLAVAADGTTTWAWTPPPRLGQYRARITSPSRSSYATIEVVEPPAK